MSQWKKGSHAPEGPKGTQWCPHCKRHLQLKYFFPSYRHKQGSWCEFCEADRDHRRLSGKRGIRVRILRHYGAKCVKCDEERPACLQIDHVNPLPGQLKGDELLSDILARDFPSDYQILCANCNLVKAAERRKTWAAGLIRLDEIFGSQNSP